MKTKILKTITEFSMLEKEDRVLVGVSGGVDSVVLLHLLLALKKSYSWEVLAVHINHQIRGQEAEEDEQFVRELCRKLGVFLHVKRANVLKTAKESGQSVEEAARNIRYALLREIAKEAKAKIATAHTLSDSVETVVLNLARGTGLRGLCGIPPVREGIIRPLIETTRAEIEDYARQNNLKFVTDSTNADVKYKRNKVRKEIVPRLNELNPAFARVFLRACHSLREDEEFLEAEAKKAICKACAGENRFLAAEITDLPGSLKFRVIKGILMQNNVLCEASKVLLIDKALKAGCGKISLNGLLFCRVKDGLLWFEKQKNSPKPEEFMPLKVLGPGFYKGPGGQELMLKKLFKPKILVPQSNKQGVGPWLLDLKAVQGGLVMRTRCPKDKLKLCGSGCTKTIKKLFNERKVPLRERANRIILADDEGVVWVDGLGPDARVCVKSTTDEALLVEVR